MTNVDLGIALIDRFVQLLSIRQQNKEKYFHDFVEPMYRDAESIMTDYTSLFGQLISKLNGEDDLYTITAWIEERRLQLLPLRMKVRGLLRRGMYPANLASMDTLDTFQRGIWGIMRGGLSLTEEGHADMSDYGWGDHTVLDLLYEWHEQPISWSRESYIMRAEGQLASLQRAWEDVVKGYADIKVAILL